MSDEETSPGPKWYALRSQTKREHVAAAALTHKFGEEVAVFCPRIRYRKPTKRGPIWWVEPLFPGYLLARFDLILHLREVLHVNGVSGAVQFGRVLPEISGQFVEELRRDFPTADSGESILNVERKLGVGDEVELTTGAFRGLNGVILEVLPSKERVQVLLEFMGQSRPVELDVFSLLVKERASE